MGDKALAVATSIASRADVVTALQSSSDYTAINQEIESLRQLTEADFIVIAIGHSATETYRMLINRDVPFQTKNFAIGMGDLFGADDDLWDD